MRPPDLDAGLCRRLAPEVLESTFHFSGSNNVALTPSPQAQRAWDAAKEICIECPVFLRCRETCWGEEYGVVGGTDEHERHLRRRQLTNALARKDADERAQLAAYFHTRHAGGLGDSAGLMARTTGYSKQAVQALMDEHQAMLHGRQAPKGASPSAPPALDAPVWPNRRPIKGDGWVWYRRQARHAHYVGETEDGLYLLMKIKPTAAQTTRWFPADQVDLRVAVCREVRAWVGRPEEGRVDGEASEDDQRAGQSAA